MPIFCGSLISVFGLILAMENAVRPKNLETCKLYVMIIVAQTSERGNGDLVKGEERETYLPTYSR